VRRWLGSIVTTSALIALIALIDVAAASPDDLVARPLVLADGQLAVDASVEASLAPGRFAQPLSLAPDAWWGATPRLTVGVITSHRALDEIAAGGGLCLRDTTHTCVATFEDVAVDARWSWRAGALAIAPRGRLLLRALSPLKPAITVGALIRWQAGRFAVIADPFLQLGIANRDQGNRAQLWLPLWLAIQPTCRWRVALHTGVHGELAVFGDAWRAPLALAVTARATDEVDVSVEAGFRSLGGPQNNLKDAAAIVTIGWRR
jgi:hypothetical protein